jgi:hypothetical protein
MKEQNLLLRSRHRHGGVPPDSYREAIGMKVETKEGEGSEFIIQLPVVIAETGS